jgi:conjugal transfer/entry exclusion protein
MDTGAYMQNQMDNLITAGMLQFDEFCLDLDSRIAEYIKQQKYTWTVGEIIKQYREKYCNNYYVSSTCKDVIEKFSKDLEIATGMRKV